MHFCRALVSFLILSSAAFTVSVTPAVAQPATNRPDGVVIGPAQPAVPSTARSGSLRRIARGVQMPLPSPSAGALRVDVALTVFGAVPAAVWLDDADLLFGAPVSGAPTHDDMLSVVTPVPLRATAPYRRLRPTLSLER